ncbi:putative nucleotide-sugar transporter YMD8 [Chaetomidium leptoderma]|uniref:Nucleotide-sugar transporter YMD8 n=1 Tax=Chaetomidium leptoderma TaxID=669021 RepID=A0AAN6ZYH8_9PEZI|nr:putative nucleotide-sugar transporter YMD8 [Chaetomidium leptoderma]
MPVTSPSSTPFPHPPPSSALFEDGLVSTHNSDHVSHPPAPPVLGHATAATSGSTSEAAQVAAAPVPDPWTRAHPQSTGAGLDPDDVEIEMDAVTPAGHRRRRSSLINPANASNSRHRSPRPRSLSSRTPANGDDEGKIVEESSDGEVSIRPGEIDEDDLTDEDLHDDEEAGLTGKDRRRKRRKRRRNQLLDQRVVREGISPEEKQEADRNVARSLLVNGVLIGLWYFFSLLISLYNKWMFSPDKLNFRFPMFTTAVHFLVQFSLASLVLFLIPSMRPQNGRRSDLGQSRHEPEPERPIMTKMFYLTRIGPCGVATGLDIGLGNTSLQFITLTFYTMCKSSSLAFVLIFAFLFRLESPTWKLVGIIATMTLGVVMMVAGEVEFKLGGFVLVIAAAFFSGFRWALTQILLLRNPATSNPFSSIFFLAPVMFVTLVSIAIPVEGPRALLAGLEAITEEKGALLTVLIILFPGVIAFLMTASEFALLQRTSVVTLSIAGIFKEAVTISAAALVFGDTMTPVNIIGLVVTLVAIATYNWIKINKMRSEAQTNVHRGHLAEEEEEEEEGRLPLSGSGSGSGSGSDGDDDQGGEDMGLLRRSVDNDHVLFTADGGDVVAGPGPEVTAARGDGPLLKDGRTD